MTIQQQYRVLVTGDLSAMLPLVSEVEGFEGAAPQEFCGWGYTCDIDRESKDETYGEIWEFITDQPAAMEAALNADPAVVTFRVNPW